MLASNVALVLLSFMFQSLEDSIASTNDNWHLFCSVCFTSWWTICMDRWKYFTIFKSLLHLSVDRNCQRQRCKQQNLSHLPERCTFM